MLNITTYLQAIIEFGFSLSATRQVPSAEQDGKINRLFSTVLFSRLLLYSGICVFSVLYIFIGCDTTESKNVFLIMYLALVAFCFQQNWFFLAKQDMKIVSIANVVSRIVLTVSIFVFVKSPEDLLVYCLLYSVSPLIANFWGLAVSIKKYKLRIVAIPFQEILNFLKSSSYVFFTQFGAVVFSSIGITCLKIFTSDYDVGVYSAIYKIPYIILMIWGPVSQVIFPLSCKCFADSYDKGVCFVKKTKKYCILFFGILILLTAIMSNFIVMIFFGNEYIEHVYIVYPLLIWVLLGIQNNFMGIQTLIAAGYDKEYGKCFQYGIYSTVFFSFVLTWLFGIWGAALAPAISELILYFAFRFKVNRIENIC